MLKKSQVVMIHKPRKFIAHLLLNTVVGLITIILGLFIGMLGYHIFEHMTWVDSFANAAMILSGMGPLVPMVTIAGKIFAGCYALFSGLAFIAIVAIIFAPVMHKFFVKVHLESMSKINEKQQDNN